jgi:flagellar hook assembly protein FlgD
LQLQVLAPNPLKLPDERLQIVYALTQSGTARVRILDAANNLVRELVPWRFHAAGQYHCEFWDGTAYDGASVPTGVYYVLIEAAQQRWVLPVFVRR